MYDFTTEELEWITNTLGYYQNDGGINLDEIPTLESVLNKCELQIKHIERHGKMKKYFENLNEFYLQQQSAE